jgi:Mrp family chromosome partitioning ATPase
MLGNKHNAPLFNKVVTEHVQAQALNHARTTALRLNKTLREQPSYVLGITSAVPEEGKSTMSRALAEVLGTDFAHEVVLADLHAEQPAVPSEAAQRLARPGLNNWARGDQVLDEVLITNAGWTALGCGTGAPTSLDLLHTVTRHSALHRLRERFPVVLLDLPPLSNAAGAALANLCDGVVLVTRAGKTPADVVKAALPSLRDVQVHGVVLNRQQRATPRLLHRLWA